MPHIADIGGISDTERPIVYVDMECYVSPKLRDDPDVPVLVRHQNFVEFVEVRKLDEGDHFRFGDDPEDKELFQNFNKYYDNIKNNIQENAPELWEKMKHLGPGKMIRDPHSPCAPELAEPGNRTTFGGILRQHSAGELPSPAPDAAPHTAQAVPALMPPPAAIPTRHIPEKAEAPPPRPHSDTDDALSAAAEDFRVFVGIETL